MSDLATQELWSIFDARRVKAPELRGLDSFVNGMVGWVKNRQPVLKNLKTQADRIEKLEPEIHALGASRFREEVAAVRELARMKRVEGDSFERAVALVREGALRATGMRPFPCQLMGAITMCN